MKYYKKTVVEVERSILERLVCDLCGEEAKGGVWERGKGIYNINDVTINHVWGVSYPDDACGEKIEFDICPDCFDNKLVPWMESQGACVGKEEWEW